MRKFISEYFSFSKRELKSLLVFEAILVVVILLRIFIPIWYTPDLVVDTELMEELHSFSESFKSSPQIEYTKKSEAKPGESPAPLKLDFFDPNEITKSELIDFGIPSRIAENFIKYRRAGGIFKSKEDVLKIYGIKEVAGETILAFIRFKTDEETKIPDTLTGRKEINPFIPVELNSGSYQSLIELIPGNSKLVSRILNYKELIGGYYSPKQLMEVFGMTGELYNSFIPMISIDTSNIQKLSLGQADYSSLLRHPYLEKKDVDLIFQYRNYAGEASNVKEFKALKIFPDSLMAIIAPYLSD